MKKGPQFVKKSVRNLETLYGTFLDYYKPITNTIDITTGANSRSYNSLTLKRVLVLPFKVKRGFLYDTSYLAAGDGAGKNFAFGAMYDEGSSTVILRATQLHSVALKTLFVPELMDHFSWHAKKYDVKTVESYPDIGMYVVEVVRAESSHEYFFKKTHELCLSSLG